MLLKKALLSPTAHISSPVSVAQVNTTVSPGHSLTADESSVTVEMYNNNHTDVLNVELFLIANFTSSICRCSQKQKQ